MKSRKQMIEDAIGRSEVSELLRLAEGYPCACKGAVDDEPMCFCRMNSQQVRSAISLAALRRGRILPLVRKK